MNRLLILLGAIVIAVVIFAWLKMRPRAQEPEAPPKLDQSVEYSYYEVSGKSTADINAGILNHSSWGASGELSFDPALWHPKWFVEGAPIRDGCVPGPFEVTSHITVNLPKWNPPADGDASVVQWWNDRLATIKAHMDSHAEIAVQSAKELFDRLKAMPSRPDCASLQEDADRVAKSILDEYDAKQTEYDATTDHGRNQSAWRSGG